VSTSKTRVKSAPPSEGGPGQPFDPSVVARAEELAARYHVRVRQEGHSAYVGIVAELPTVFGCGASEGAAADKTRELLKWALGYLIENGRTPPAPRPKA
jgi:hypothetical protein